MNGFWILKIGEDRINILQPSWKDTNFEKSRFEL